VTGTAAAEATLVTRDTATAAQSAVVTVTVNATVGGAAVRIAGQNVTVSWYALVEVPPIADLRWSRAREAVAGRWRW